MIKAVLFDLDGTFADTAPDLGAALNHVRTLHDLPSLPIEAIRPQASHGSIGLLKIGFNIGPDAPDFAQLREEFLNYYDTHICIHTILFNGMAQLIEKLEQNRLPWGIVTNKPHRFTLPLMQALGYAQRAACLISGDTCTRAKPHPDPLLKASEIMNIAPQYCLYLGDDKRDVTAGLAAGMKTLIARYGYINEHEDLAAWKANGIISSPMEVLDHLAL